MMLMAPRSVIGGLLATFAIGLALALPHPAAAQGRGGKTPANYALPSDIIAQEIAFARLVETKGQWPAFRATAAHDAQMITDDAVVDVQSWTRNKPNPANPLRWKTHAVWMSCDGSYAVTYGGWQAGAGVGAQGWFSTVWARQKGGDYKWVLDQGDTTAQPIPEPEWIEAKVAECPVRPKRPLGTPPLPTGAAPPAITAPIDHLSGEAIDHTLAWSTRIAADGTREYLLRMRIGTQMQDVLQRKVAPTHP
jgi:hypothetical protein